MIIAFFGPDGAGKTTLAKLLATYFAIKKYKVSYIRFKSHHLAMYFLLRFLQKLNIVPNTSSPRILDYSLRRYFNRDKLFLYLEIINAIIWLITNIKLRKMIKGGVIVAERYIHDFIVSMLLLGSDKSTLYRLLKIMKLFMNDTIRVYLCASPVDILGRKRDELLSINYVNILVHLYLLAIRFLGVDLYINTSRHNRLEAFQQIRDFITSRLHYQYRRETKTNL